MFCWSRSPRKRKSPKKREPPRARVRLFDRGVPSIYLFILFIHRPLPLLQVNIVVRISLNIPWLKSWNNQKYFYVLILIQSINFRPSFQWCSMEVQPELSSSPVVVDSPESIYTPTLNCHYYTFSGEPAKTTAHQRIEELEPALHKQTIYIQLKWNPTAALGFTQIFLLLMSLLQHLELCNPLHRICILGHKCSTLEIKGLGMLKAIGKLCKAAN